MADERIKWQEMNNNNDSDNDDNDGMAEAVMSADHKFK